MTEVPLSSGARPRSPSFQGYSLLFSKLEQICPFSLQSQGAERGNSGYFLGECEQVDGVGEVGRGASGESSLSAAPGRASSAGYRKPSFPPEHKWGVQGIVRQRQVLKRPRWLSVVLNLPVGCRLCRTGQGRGQELGEPW